MRVLGLETSSRRGSVALVVDGQLVAARAHERPNAHAEELLGLVTAVLEEAGTSRVSLSRIGVGVGPGSFTGLRVGIALGQGIALGLELPLLGVGSLRCMARAVPPTVGGTRWAVLDARRGEVFCAAYGADGTEIVAPRVLRRQSALAQLAELQPPGPRVLVGEAAAELDGQDLFRSAETDLPHAQWVAVLATEAQADGAAVQPKYVREPDAVRPDLPPAPLAKDFET